ncbi:MAG: CpsD/CapB family tyrosine-protein kinase [Terrisporobacter othiniensis]|uniref:CpsD/CapB family tyrosine-protein kinase n=1 Tax=Terrisporobacter othiniensis TaxID=1577792 RepID=UPI002A75E634|nr:CpsD/CapB family tyrosine-protein kinase [Terrisporobacter othiniensis]MDY3373061.1 CpsD/CapB family tyrosine-protein kinase [Terrisporobacter othiniensis]
MQKITELDQKSPIAEAYRTLRTNISFSDIDNKIQTILFTSTKQNEGKSTIISNVAYSFSKLENCRVLLMDLDLRNPTVHKMFGVSNTYGLMDNLKNDRPIEKCIHKIEENIHVLPTGSMPPNPSEILSSKKMASFLREIKMKYDYVFIDTPPVGVVSDATIISKNVDGVMYVVGANETDLSHVQVAIENLRKVDANILGSVLNKYAMNQSSYTYYSYYYNQDEGTGRAARKKKKKFGLFKKKKLSSVR